MDAGPTTCAGRIDCCLVNARGLEVRPKGVIRVALRESAQRLANEKGGASWREIAAGAVLRVDGRLSVSGEREQRGVAPGLARQTVKNMVYAGELAEIGREKRAGSTHWHALYAPVERQPQLVEEGARSLANVISSWAHRGV